jgi:hypothetical protein
VIDIKALAVEAGIDDSAPLTPYMLQRLEVFAQGVARECAAEVERSASIIDHPSCYMGGASNNATRKAQQLADAIRARFGLEG